MSDSVQYYYLLAFIAIKKIFMNFHQLIQIFIYRFRDFLDTLLLDGRLIMTQKQIQMAGFSLSVSGKFFLQKI